MHITQHGDGTITYFSVSDQRWHRRVSVLTVPDREVAAMPEPMRKRIIAAQDYARASVREAANMAATRKMLQQRTDAHWTRVAAQMEHTAD